MLPANVLRPTPATWESAYGDRAVPPGYGGRVLEVGMRLDTSGIGASIGELQPGMRACPMHHHLFEEELFLVLEGELTVRELRPGASAYDEYTLRAGELVAYPPGTGIAHQSQNRSSAPVRTLCLSDARAPNEVCVYPESGKVLIRCLGARGLGVFTPVGQAAAPLDERFAAARAAATARGVRLLGPHERPSHVASAEGVREIRVADGVHARSLASAAGATRLQLHRLRVEPGAVASPLRWHTADEELLVVLGGRPVVRQVHDGTDERVALQPGDVVLWKAGPAVARQLLGGEEPADVIVVRTDRDDDVTVLPELGRVFVRALGREGTVEPTGYWAGEHD